VIPLSAGDAGRALGRGPLAAQVAGISTDSRVVHPGDLFVALRGERFDGHDFVGAALAAGASGAVVDARWWAGKRGARVGSRPRDVLRDRAPVIYPVDDSLAALGALAREVRRRSAAKVVAITGSVGKTSTKDLLAAMAGRTHRAVVTAANQNNEVGVPLTLLAVGPDTEVVIVEMGMRGRGQIEALARVAEPDVGVVTNIHPVHLELLGTLEDIAQAKAELLTCLSAAGVAVIPADCGLLWPHAAGLSCRVLRFGFGAGSERAEVHGSLGTARMEWGSVLSVVWPEGRAEVEVPFRSRHRLENTVAAAAACFAAGLPMEQCLPGVNEVRFTGSRGDVMRLAGLVIINDTYNASPAAVRAALDDLVDLAARTGGRPVAILGDMLELGPEAERYHREAGAYAAEAGVCALWGVGPLSRSTVEGYRHAQASLARVSLCGGTPAAGSVPGATVPQAPPKRESVPQAGHVRSSDEASPVVGALRSGDVVLLKASRNMRLENVVSRLVVEAAAGRWGRPPEVGADRDGTKGRRRP
jgi:UDP-N-acetylmuramoyl-tripeptide--D-alanyl-D-alanine ligase